MARLTRLGARSTMMPGWLQSWLARHRHPVSRWLHAIGIPVTLWAVGLAGLQLARSQWDLWWRPVALLAGGYLLQWIGHRVEGNDMGEVILVKKALGRPYVAVAPDPKTAQRKVVDG